MPNLEDNNPITEPGTYTTSVPKTGWYSLHLRGTVPTGTTVRQNGLAVPEFDLISAEERQAVLFAAGVIEIVTTGTGNMTVSLSGPA